MKKQLKSNILKFVLFVVVLFLIVVVSILKRKTHKNDRYFGGSLRTTKINRVSTEDDCSSTNNAPKRDQCEYSKSHCVDEEGDGLIKYVYWRWCAFRPVIFVYFIILGFLIIYYFILMGDVANKNFVSSLLFVADTIGMSEHMVGFTFLAIGNAAGDLFTQIAASRQLKYSMCVGESAGAGLTVTTIVISTIIIFSKKTYFSKTMIYRDLLMYVMCGLLFVEIILTGKYTLIHIIVCPLVFLGYVIVVYLMEKLKENRRKNKKNDGQIEKISERLNLKKNEENNDVSEGFINQDAAVNLSKEGKESDGFIHRDAIETVNRRIQHSLKKRRRKIKSIKNNRPALGKHIIAPLLLHPSVTPTPTLTSSPTPSNTPILHTPTLANTPITLSLSLSSSLSSLPSPSPSPPSCYSPPPNMPSSLPPTPDILISVASFPSLSTLANSGCSGSSSNTPTPFSLYSPLLLSTSSCPSLYSPSPSLTPSTPPFAPSSSSLYSSPSMSSCVVPLPSSPSLSSKKSPFSNSSLQQQFLPSQPQLGLSATTVSYSLSSSSSPLSSSSSSSFSSPLVVSGLAPPPPLLLPESPASPFLQTSSSSSSSSSCSSSSSSFSSSSSPSSSSPSSSSSSSFSSSPSSSSSSCCQPLLPQSSIPLSLGMNSDRNEDGKEKKGKELKKEKEKEKKGKEENKDDDDEKEEEEEGSGEEEEDNVNENGSGSESGSDEKTENEKEAENGNDSEKEEENANKNDGDDDDDDKSVLTIMVLPNPSQKTTKDDKAIDDYEEIAEDSNVTNDGNNNVFIQPSISKNERKRRNNGALLSASSPAALSSSSSPTISSSHSSSSSSSSSSLSSPITTTTSYVTATIDIALTAEQQRKMKEVQREENEGKEEQEGGKKKRKHYHSRGGGHTRAHTHHMHNELTRERRRGDTREREKEKEEKRCEREMQEKEKERYRKLPWYKKASIYIRDTVCAWTEWSEHGVWGRVLEVLVFPFTVLRVVTIPAIDIDKDGNDWIRIVLNALTTPLAVLVLNGMTDILTDTIAGLPGWAFFLLLGGILLPLFLVFNMPRFRRFLLVKFVFAFWSFLMSIVWLNMLGGELLAVLRTVCFFTHLDENIAATTILAWGQSVGDLVGNLSIVLSNRPISGLTACYASPMFNNLVNLAISAFTYCLTVGSFKAIRIDRSFAVFSAGLGIVICSLVMFGFAVALKGHMRRWVGVLVLGAYMVCLTLIVLIQVNVITWSLS